MGLTGMKVFVIRKTMVVGYYSCMNATIWPDLD